MIDTAVVLAGGLSTRLRPLTDNLPKPLLPMKGKAILEHTIHSLRKQGITNIIISIGYQAEKVKQYFQHYQDTAFITENEPLGTGGAVKQAGKGITNPFFLVWGDNLMDINYTALEQAHRSNGTAITMALTPREDVEHFGVAQLDGKKIISFVEKPSQKDAPSTLINAGAFVIHPDVLSMLPEGKSSLEKECFEKFAPQGKIGMYLHPGQWFPTDTLEKYKEACLHFLPDIQLQEKTVIIADVDETICESNQVISPETAEVVNKLIKTGMAFAVISGTDVKELQRMVSSGLEEEHHLLAASGTQYYHQGRKGISTEIYSLELPQEERRVLLAALQKLIQHFSIPCHSPDHDQILDRKSQVTFSAIGRNAPLHLKKEFDPSGEKRKEWIEFLKNCLPQDAYELTIGGTTSIDITPQGRTKEHGIRAFARHHNIELSRIIYLGDKIYPGGNDYEASKAVDCIAVRNHHDACETLKKVLEVTSSPP